MCSYARLRPELVGYCETISTAFLKGPLFLINDFIYYK